MLSALLGRNILLNLVREEHHSNLIVVLNGAECKRCGYFRYHITLHLLLRSEIERAADINEQHHRKFTFLLINLYIRSMKTCGDIPVNITNIVTKLVFAHLAERHTAAFESRMVLAGKDIATQASCLYFNLTNLFQYVRCLHLYSNLRYKTNSFANNANHQGTSTLLIILLTISSLVTLLASAS